MCGYLQSFRAFVSPLRIYRFVVGEFIQFNYINYLLLSKYRISRTYIIYCACYYFINFAPSSPSLLLLRQNRLRRQLESNELGQFRRAQVHQGRGTKGKATATRWYVSRYPSLYARNNSYCGSSNGAAYVWAALLIAHTMLISKCLHIRFNGIVAFSASNSMGEKEDQLNDEGARRSQRTSGLIPYRKKLCRAHFSKSQMQDATFFYRLRCIEVTGRGDSGKSSHLICVDSWELCACLNEFAHY